MLKRAYKIVWPFAFLAGGIVAVTADGHVHFSIFGIGMDLHSLMWFLMAMAHADALWGWKRRSQPAADIVLRRG